MTQELSRPSSGDAGDALKRGDRDRHHRHRLRSLEWLTVLHLAVFLIAATWAFGGQSDAVRGPLTAWGAIGGLLTLAALLREDTERRSAAPLLWWAAPMLAFNVLVLVASTNPTFREIRNGAETALVNTGGRAQWPGSARPLLARHGLWEFDVIWVSCFNLALVLRRRRAIRVLLSVAAFNALALAVFGTMQKLSGANGLFFGAVATPQKYFFASFVYHNHWGAFILLMLGTALALSAHYVRRRQSRDFLHSPASMGLVAVLILAATIPLSASRSSTALAVILLSGAFVHWMKRLVQKRRQFNESTAPVIVAATAAIVLGLAAVWYVAGPTIARRAALTREQVEHARTSHTRDARIQLYEDTARMAVAKPWFGWGMASYPWVFTLYNTRHSVDGLPVFYHDAHSDWLQSLAEHGVIGTSLLVASALVPLLWVRRRLFDSALPAYVLAGCATVIVYATLEFPFGNFAVVLSWWLCFFSAIQYVRLTAAKLAEGAA
jgi:O-antigen ligase